MSTHVHPTAVVGPGVELDDDVVLAPHAVLLGPAVVGRDVVIGAGAVVGAPPEIVGARQNAAWSGELEHAGVEIGARTVVRECATVHQGTVGPTRVGPDCWLLNRSYVAHDCQVGAGVTLSAGVSLGGHVRVDDRANLGMGVLVHQRRLVGAGAMVGMGAVVTHDVPPFALAHGVPVRLHGVNAVGLRRAGSTEPDVAGLAALYARGTPVALDELPAALRAAWESWAALGPVTPLLPLTS